MRYELNLEKYLAENVLLGNALFIRFDFIFFFANIGFENY
jgi:hypothetical protein